MQRVDDALRGDGVEPPRRAVGLLLAQAGSQGGERLVESLEQLGQAGRGAEREVWTNGWWGGSGTRRCRSVGASERCLGEHKGRGGGEREVRNAHRHAGPKGGGDPIRPAVWVTWDWWFVVVVGRAEAVGAEGLAGASRFTGISGERPARPTCGSQARSAAAPPALMAHT